MPDVEDLAVGLEVEFHVLDVCELHFQAVGASAAVAEVGLAEAFGGDVAQLLLAGAGLLGVEQAGRVLRGQACLARAPKPSHLAGTAWAARRSTLAPVAGGAFSDHHGKKGHAVRRR